MYDTREINANARDLIHCKNVTKLESNLHSMDVTVTEWRDLQGLIVQQNSTGIMVRNFIYYTHFFILHPLFICVHSLFVTFSLCLTALVMN